MLPSSAYDFVSVDPAGGSTAKAATTMKDAMSSVPTRGRHPRATAIRPAPTPTAATTAAPHMTNRIWFGSLSDTHHGGAPDVCTIAGTTIDGPAAETPIITISETAMQETEVQANTR